MLPTEPSIFAKTPIEVEIEDGDESLDGFVELSPIFLKLTDDACGERLDKVLSKLVPQYSRSRIQQWIEAGHVTVDGQPGKGKTTVLGDEDIIILPQAAPEEQAFKPEPMDLPIIYEDADILVIDKPPGLVVHPAAGNWSGTLLNGLLYRYPALGGVPRAASCIGSTKIPAA